LNLFVFRPLNKKQNKLRPLRSLRLCGEISILDKIDSTHYRIICYNETVKYIIGIFGAIWGLTGVLLLLGSAVYRLTPIAIDAFSYAFTWYHWTTLLLILFFMAYAEGYRGFQKGFSPRVAARALHMKNYPHLLHSLLGPLFCMGFFHASRRRKITSFSVTSGIIVLIILVRFLTQPWRGIIDAGVVVGLAWGLVSLIIFSLQAFTSRGFPYSPEVPEQNQ